MNRLVLLQKAHQERETRDGLTLNFSNSHARANAKLAVPQLIVKLAYLFSTSYAGACAEKLFDVALRNLRSQE